MERKDEEKGVSAGTKGAREIVWELLVERDRTHIDISEGVKAALARYGGSLTARERALVKQLALGTVERQITLDAVIDRVASVKARAMKAAVRAALRMGAFQILFLDAIRDAAAVDESVKLVKGVLPVKLAGFTNAVLRRIAREKEETLASLREAELSVRYSMPPYLCRLFEKERGREQTERIFGSFFAPRRLTLRPDPRLIKEEERYAAWRAALADAAGEVIPHPALPALLTVEEPGDVRQLPGYAEGAFVVQDAASALAVEAAGLCPDDLVLDVCAAPGGKALYAAALLRDAAQLTARDLTEGKCALLKENADRMRLPDMRIEVRDATVFDPASADGFDVVFCDLPCTGFGVIGRKPEIKYGASSRRTDALAALQREILEVACRYVKPGGILLYSTCTVSRAENEDNVGWFLASHDFQPEAWLDAGVAGAVRANVRGGCLQLLPGAMGTDGFFIARLRRRG